MDRVGQKLEAVLVFVCGVKERQADEGLPEMEAVRVARRTRTAHLRKERVGFLEELRRRAVKEKGWKPDAAEDTGTDGAPARTPGCGRAGRLRIGPHPLLPERGYVLYDRAEATVAWVREVPSPARAAELLAEHGIRWEGELLSHSLSPVPEEAEGHR